MTRLLLPLFILVGAILHAAPDGLRVGSTVPDLETVDCYGRGFSMPFHRGKVVLLFIDRLREPDITDDQRHALKAFYNTRRDNGLEIVRIGYNKGVPFFITKSYVEKRARETLEKTGTRSIFIVDWENTLRDKIGTTGDPQYFVIDKRGIVREQHTGWLVLTGELEKTVDRLMKD